MRAIVMAMVVVLVAGRCFAEDPLETLNTVEDTVSTMQHTLKEQDHQLREGKAVPGLGAGAATADPSGDDGSSAAESGNAGVGAPCRTHLNDSDKVQE